MGRAESYHHGNLRRAVLDAALAAIEESGPSGWSLRELARRAVVSHAAPAHHFGDKAGVLTAVAAEGFERFADALERAAGDPYGAGVAYVRFAVDHRAYFEVMFRPELYRADDPELNAARDRAGAVLAASGRKLARGEAADRATTLAAWSVAHGFASLWLNGALPESRGGAGVEELAREVLGVVFGGAE
ncbi:TetR/AcrR family transcriptional regulator [Kitasatospora sp. NPDC015120]|uniref:TetR/AcrR family transcriptional regulator n=1 Tax=Kitasatospora sp. NPDC015120 TaxID=3364023 RepID=UPI0036F482F6